MTRKFGIIAAVCCVAALCLALVGCSGGSTGLNKADCVGDWKLTSSTSEDLDADTMELMESLGLEVILTLNEDGTGTLDLFGDTSDVTWDASTAKVTITDMGEATLSVSGSELTLSESNGQSMTFTKQ